MHFVASKSMLLGFPSLSLALGTRWSRCRRVLRTPFCGPKTASLDVFVIDGRCNTSFLRPSITARNFRETARRIRSKIGELERRKSRQPQYRRDDFPTVHAY